MKYKDIAVQANRLLKSGTPPSEVEAWANEQIAANKAYRDRISNQSEARQARRRLWLQTNYDLAVTALAKADQRLRAAREALEADTKAPLDTF